MGAMDGRVVLVTGAGGRLGSNIAKLAATEGATVVINDVVAESAEAVAAELREAGHTVQVAITDATSFADAKALVDSIVAEHGRIDSAILAGANLAGQRYESIEEMHPDHFAEIVLSHAGGLFAMLKALIPHMKQQRYGRIVAFASATGMVGDWGFSHYSAGKGGVASLIRTAAIELDAWGININGLSPAGTPGEMVTPNLRKRTGYPAGVAPLAVYLASEAVGYMNGHIFEGSGSGRVGLYPAFVPTRYMQKPSGWSVADLTEMVPSLFDVAYTTEPRQRPALERRDPFIDSRPGDMVDQLPTGLSTIVSDGMGAAGMLDAMGLPGYNQPGPKVTPAG